MESIQGLALVASPNLTDPNFMRSVVYIVKHDEDGALGLVLNRPTDMTVGCLLEQLADCKLCNNGRVYCGGPVDGPLVMLQQVQIDERPLLAVASDQERILEACQQECGERQYRIFDGYSGWGAGQLEYELHRGGWLIWDIQPEDVFSDPEQIWQAAIRQIGRDILAGSIDPSRIPDDPAYN
ncbi:MAG: YqgE/AlgH family protein [bacterium]|nr:YqgE/AlgH family protein [bacterium]